MRKYAIELRDTQNKFYQMCSKIHTSYSHLQMELNYGKTPTVSLVMHTEFINMM
jgi:hypothetical protein